MFQPIIETQTVVLKLLVRAALFYKYIVAVRSLKECGRSLSFVHGYISVAVGARLRTDTSGTSIAPSSWPKPLRGVPGLALHLNVSRLFELLYAVSPVLLLLMDGLYVQPQALSLQELPMQTSALRLRAVYGPVDCAITHSSTPSQC